MILWHSTPFFKTFVLLCFCRPIKIECKIDASCTTTMGVDFTKYYLPIANKCWKFTFITDKKRRITPALYKMKDGITSLLQAANKRQDIVYKRLISSGIVHKEDYIKSREWMQNSPPNQPSWMWKVLHIFIHLMCKKIK